MTNKGKNDATCMFFCENSRFLANFTFEPWLGNIAKSKVNQSAYPDFDKANSLGIEYCRKAVTQIGRGEQKPCYDS